MVAERCPRKAENHKSAGRTWRTQTHPGGAPETADNAAQISRRNGRQAVKGRAALLSLPAKSRSDISDTKFCANMSLMMFFNSAIVSP